MSLYCPPELLARRNRIQALAFPEEHANVLALREMGVELVSAVLNPASDREQMHHCHWHCFGPDWSTVLNSRLRVPAGYQLASEDEPADIVLYFRPAHEHERVLFTHFLSRHVCVHSGKSLEDGRVESKFTHGNVYRHALWDVPSSYGCVAQKYRFHSDEARERAFDEVWYEGGI